MKTIALTLCAALVAAPLHLHAVPKDETPVEPQAHLLAICLVGAAAAAGAAVVWMMKTCKPKYYCVQDNEGNRFSSNATKRERQVEGWKVVSGPYSSAEAAAIACPPMTNAPAFTEQPTPSLPIRIYKSKDLGLTWNQVALINDDPMHFSWAETNSASDATALYRASY